MFLNDDFLLTTDIAKTLYHDYASKMPIIDYHCHLSPQEIYEDKNFSNITEAWLYGDHYKWRLMRANGISEEAITGNKDDYTKFEAWAKTMPHAIGSPLYAWTHLELKRFFGIDLLLNEKNSKKIYDEANKKLETEAYSRRNLIRNSNVKVICTTDDPVDDLHYHDLIAQEITDFKVYPTFRPDKGLNIDHATFVPWIKDLEKVVGHDIKTHADLIKALENRVAFFASKGCRLSDHGIDTLYYAEASEDELNAILTKALNNETLTRDEVAKHNAQTLLQLFRMYEENNWVMQLHLKAYRNNNTKMFNELGPDTGFDAINDVVVVDVLQKLLDEANRKDQLPKTILYSLNPNDYPALVTLMGCFQADVVTKLQMGSGWWFNDTRVGMRNQLTELANGSLLGHFVGMLTDSRSFLSYTRHEYFRRVLCELIGEWVERGELPNDPEFLGQIVADISFNNANRYFNFNE